MRGYRDTDQREVLALLAGAFGCWPVVEGAASPDPAAFFGWKHLRNPFGASRMAVAEREGRVVGFRAFMPWMLRAGSGTVRALRTADAATIPELQRAGVFGQVRRAADTLFGESVDLWFGTPNTLSLGATMKLGDRSVAGTVRTWTRLRAARAAVALVRGRPEHANWEPEAAPARDALADRARIDELLADAREGETRLTTAKDAAWLAWRYGEVPLDYHALDLERGGRLRALVIFRIRTRRGLPEAVIEELFAAPGDRRAPGRLLRDVGRSAPVALCSCSFPTHTVQRRGALRGGFVPWRGGSTIMIRNTAAAISPPPDRNGSWALTLGDLELV